MVCKSLDLSTVLLLHQLRATLLFNAGLPRLPALGRVATGEATKGSLNVKRVFPRFLQGGVIMDVVNGAQAKIAEQAGACAVMALEKIPADIITSGGVARMSDPLLVKEVMSNCTITVMAKARIGHFGEAKVLDPRIIT